MLAVITAVPIYIFVGAAAGAWAFHAFTPKLEERRKWWAECEAERRQATDDLSAIRRALENGGNVSISVAGKERVITTKQDDRED